jgi:hypothetical protein
MADAFVRQREWVPYSSRRKPTQQPPRFRVARERGGLSAGILAANASCAIIYRHTGWGITMADKGKTVAFFLGLWALALLALHNILFVNFSRHGCHSGAEGCTVQINNHGYYSYITDLQSTEHSPLGGICDFRSRRGHNGLPFRCAPPQSLRPTRAYPVRKDSSKDPELTGLANRPKFPATLDRDIDGRNRAQL